MINRLLRITYVYDGCDIQDWTKPQGLEMNQQLLVQISRELIIDTDKYQGNIKRKDEPQNLHIIKKKNASLHSLTEGEEEDEVNGGPELRLCGLNFTETV
ncbi:hypothetical protein PRIPAC_72885 [Pristionchus pacificus]|uniref:Uncharacterized protein n=1 Tax=Pristionchus pacificus TaxID=54126 RepID=A0A2A6C5S8_PRIPA|nr:hypothetical protein PRIPAC_72885 [Pristionchus pacificus]|eukprot:PDM73448.1 hypothetical protein PRIPAC_40804 [Pristionchus pacificus]